MGSSHLDLVHIDVSSLRDMLREYDLTPLVVVLGAGRRIFVTGKVAGLSSATGIDFHPHLLGCETVKRCQGNLHSRVVANVWAGRFRKEDIRPSSMCAPMS